MHKSVKPELKLKAILFNALSFLEDIRHIKREIVQKIIQKEFLKRCKKKNDTKAISFFASGVRVGFPLYPEVFYIMHNDPAAHQDHCGRCCIRTRDLCPRSLVCYY